MSISHVQALLCPLPLDQTGFLPDSGVVMASSGSKDGPVLGSGGMPSSGSKDVPVLGCVGMASSGSNDGPVLGSGGTGQQQPFVDSGGQEVDWSGNQDMGEEDDEAGFGEQDLGLKLGDQIRADSHLLPEPPGPSWCRNTETQATANTCMFNQRVLVTHDSQMLRRPRRDWEMHLHEYIRLIKNSLPERFFDQRLISLFEENGGFAAVACWMKTCKAISEINWEMIRNPRGYMHNNFSKWRVQAEQPNMFIYGIASI